MKILTILTASAALAAAALPAAAGCPGHDVTAEVKSEPIVTAERRSDAPPASEAPTVGPAEEAAGTRG